MSIKSFTLGFCVVVLSLAASAAAHAGEVGRIMLAAGKAQVNADGTSRAAASGMVVAEGDELRTGQDGYLYLQTRDGGFFILRPNSTAKVTVFRFDPARPELSQVKVDLGAGVARMVTGEASKQARDHFRMNTPVAAIGVRGTDFTVFADDTVMRASVHSGGIVVGTFNEACSPAGTGPCGGEAARVLMAGAEPMVVEVQRGDKQPRLLKSEQLLPDRAAPPGPGEPGEKHSATGNPPPEAQYVAASTPVNRPLPTVPLQEPPATPPPPVVSPPPIVAKPDPTPVTPPPVEVVTEPPVVVVQPPPRVITWGRWQEVADLPANVDVAAAVNSGRKLIALGPVQALFRDSSQGVSMPNEGQASFTLREHEGWFRNEVTGQAVSAQAGNSSLSVDFGRRTFATSLDLAGGGLSTQVRASGLVGGDGTFQSDVLAPANVTGTLGGSNANQAGYLYHQRVNNQVTVDGATFWTR